MTTIKDRIKELRKEKGLTQEKLAKLLGLNAKSSIANYENGANSPSDEVKIKMCTLFNCSMDYLMGKSNQRKDFNINIPDLLYQYRDYIIESNMPKIKYDILTDDDKTMLQEMFINFANELNGKKDIKPISYYKNKISDEEKWNTVMGIYIVYIKYAHDVFSEISGFFGHTFTQNTGIKFKQTSKLKGKIPVLGIVKAGYDYLAEENIMGYISVNDNSMSGDDFFALKVKGNSMEPIIFENDIAIIKKQSDFENGDIVVAIVNGDEATIKRAYKTDSGLLLQPANSYVEPLIFTKEEIENIPVSIVGIVYNITRKFK